MTRHKETIGIGDVLCSLEFEKGFFWHEFGIVLADYRQWGFCSEGIPDITIVVKESHIPEPYQITKRIFYHSMKYDAVNATMVFDAERFKGEIGFVTKEVSNLTPVRILELIETFLSTAYLFYFFLNDLGTFIHASGIAEGDEGYIFAGPSGHGKSTIAKLSLPRTVLCDEMVLLKRNDGGKAKVFGTPFIGESGSINRGVDCNGIYFIEKSDTNEIQPISRMAGTVQLVKEGVMGNFISIEGIQRIYPYPRFLTLVTELLKGISCYTMRFRKDNTFWGMIHG